jgi:hypothetical protein
MFDRQPVSLHRHVSRGDVVVVDRQHTNIFQKTFQEEESEEHVVSSAPWGKSLAFLREALNGFLGPGASISKRRSIF